MCDCCLSFLSCNTDILSERLSSWKQGFLHLIETITSYNGPFTGLEVHHVSINGHVTAYRLTDSRLEVTLVAMGGCTSSSNKSPSNDGNKKHNILPINYAPKQKCNDHNRTLTSVQFLRPDNSHGCKKRMEAIQIRNTKATTNRPFSAQKINMNGTTNVACLFSQQGRKGLNQDAMIVWEGFNPKEDAVFCGVFDGHGPYGHFVAQLVRDMLPPKLMCNWEFPYPVDVREHTTQNNRENHDANHEMGRAWKESFLHAYMLMDKELREWPHLDCFCSGTTAVTLIKQGADVYLANVGDSRAILGTKLDDGSLTALQLTVDLKPNLPEEAERIRQCRGRVFALQDEPEVHRVWLPHDNSPGLAMARAFGDFCLKNFGVIAVPELSYHRLTYRDQFIVLATDGVWDVLSNEEVVNIVASVSVRSHAAEAVVEKAVHEWKSKYATSRIDDCSVICLFLEDIITPPSTRSSKKQRVGARQKQQLIAPAALSCEQSKAIASNTKDVSIETSEKAGQSSSLVSIELGSTKFSSNTISGEANDNAIFGISNLAATEDARDELAVFEIYTAFDEDWRALDGVTRVNSLVNLPRFKADSANANGN